MARARRGKGEKPGQAKPPEPDTSKTSDLILPSGRVDRSAIFRAAQEDAQRRKEALADDPDLVSAALDAPSAPASAPDSPGESDADDDDLSPPAPPAQPQRVVFRLTRDLDKRLDKYLTDRISFLSRSKLQALIESGGVKVNAKPAKSSTNLRLGDTVEVLIEPPPTEDVPPENIPLEALFEDEHLIVINKSPDIIVHPARSHLKGTMINALAYHFRHTSPLGGHLSGVGGEFARPGVVHRLDRQTSGVILFAKTDQAHWNLANQFQNRTVDKRYIALVHGAVEPLVDVIDEPLGPHPSREKGYRELQVVRHDHLGKPAVSVYRVLGVYGGGAAGRGTASPASMTAPSPGWKPPPSRAVRATPAHRRDVPEAGPVSLVEVELKTGRTHQIRVHLQHRGYPLLADDLYGGKVVTLPSGIAVSRVALHAALLTFRHPISGKPMEFRAHFPDDLRTFLAGLRRGPITIEPAEPPGAKLRIADLL